MFRFARVLVQNKLVLVAVALVGYFLFAGEKEAPTPSSPWATNAHIAVTAEKNTTLTDRALKLVNSAAEYAGVEEYLPTALRDQAVDGFSKTENALVEATKPQD